MPEAAKPANDKGDGVRAANRLDTHKLDTALTREEGDFQHAWQWSMVGQERSGLKPLLRLRKDRLEELYGSM